MITKRIDVLKNRLMNIYRSVIDLRVPDEKCSKAIRIMHKIKEEIEMEERRKEFK